MIKKLTAIFCLMIFSLFYIKMPPSVLSEEVRFHTPSYEGKELEKVRQWEKTWVGKKIDSTNVDEVKEFLPDTLYSITKNTEKWGESWFEIVPYREYKMTPGTIEATKKYSPSCRIGEKKELIGWTAGIPFPEPKSGIEVAWNFYCWTRGDTQSTYAPAYIVDGRRKYDRRVAFNVHTAYFAGRRNVPPTPEILPNRKQIYRGAYAEFTEPSEMKGFLNLQITYKDPLKPYDAWAWVAAIRRIRRLSTSQRTDTVGGQDLCYDDNFGWDGAITRNNYKLLGKKEILATRHQDPKRFEHTEGDCILDGVQKERVNMWVLEAANKDPGYIYKKSIWYVDPELWHISYINRYDKYGSLWKTYDQFQAVFKGYKGQDDHFFYGQATIDHQRKHSTLGSDSVSQLGIEIPLEMFTIRNLQKHGR